MTLSLLTQFLEGRSTPFHSERTNIIMDNPRTT